MEPLYTKGPAFGEVMTTLVTPEAGALTAETMPVVARAYVGDWRVLVPDLVEVLDPPNWEE